MSEECARRTTEGLLQYWVYCRSVIVHRAPIINKRGKDKKETFIVTSTSLSVLCVSVHELLEITITVSAAHQREFSDSNLLSTSDR